MYFRVAKNLKCQLKNLLCCSKKVHNTSDTIPDKDRDDDFNNNDIIATKNRSIAVLLLPVVAVVVVVRITKHKRQSYLQKYILLEDSETKKGDNSEHIQQICSFRQFPCNSKRSSGWINE